MSSITLRPSEIRYSQDTISHKFSNGTPLTSTFARLISGKEKVTDLPALKCVSRYGKWYSGPRGNRRLFLYKKLEEAGVITTINVLRYRNDAKDFTITGSGLTVRCEEPSTESKINEIISQWRRGVDVVEKWGTTPGSSAASSYRGYHESDPDSYDHYSHGSWNSTPVASSSWRFRGSNNDPYDDYSHGSSYQDYDD